jgi:hypothetical protein
MHQRQRSPAPREYPGYHDMNERLVGWRREILTRMDRLPELALLPSFPRTNLAAADGVSVRVDSFLGTRNTSHVPDVYFPVIDAAAGNCAIGALDFTVEDSAHATLQALRERFDLDAIAGSGSDLERMVRLRDWIKSLFPHHTPYRMPEWNALVILDRGSRGVENFICMHYSVSLVQCCLALGLQARVVNLHRGIADSYVIGHEASADPPVDEHVVAEIWSAEDKCWVMQDTDFDCHYERDGRPLSAWDIHRAFVESDLDSLTCRRGPHSQSLTALGNAIDDDDRFFRHELPSYYAHVSVLMRNDFLSDPDGPVPVAHLTDAATAPIIWHRGSDMRLQRHLMGPLVVATPYTNRVSLLTDGNTATGWASTDAPVAHWVQVELPLPQLVARIGLHWPEYATAYRSSRRLIIETLTDAGWRPLTGLEIEPEGPFVLHEIAATTVRSLRVVQAPGDGHPSHPNRLWLTQIELLGPTDSDNAVRFAARQDQEVGRSTGPSDAQPADPHVSAPAASDHSGVMLGWQTSR